MIKRLRKTLVAVTGCLCVLLSACGGGSDAPATSAPPIAGCSTSEQVQFVFDLMNDIYFWIDDVPAVANSGFSTPESVIEAFRFSPLDVFSGIRDREENTSFFSASQFIGFGIGLKTTGTRVHVTQAFSDGPAAAAGLTRGDEIVAIDGRTVSDIINSGDTLSAAFGADEIGVVAIIDYVDAAGSALQVQLSKALVTIETVTIATQFDVAGQTVGYLAFRNFVEPSFAALEAAFAQFTAAGVDALVVDLRYNGGGLISVAEFLGGLIGGMATDGQVFAERRHNAANDFRNVTSRFNDEVNALDLNEVLIITSAATASASELVINALDPFASVTLIGEATFGKPVGSYQYEFCDKVAVPIAFANDNAVGFGDYFNGLPVNCVATDDLTRALGDPQEASLAEALYFLQNGECSAPTIAAGKTAGDRAVDKTRARLGQRSEMRQLLNAW